MVQHKALERVIVKKRIPDGSRAAITERQVAFFQAASSKAKAFESYLSDVASSASDARREQEKKEAERLTSVLQLTGAS